jgi:POT family proton-dependent oligopeptide transporter
MRQFKTQLFAQYPSGFTPLFFTQAFFNFGFYGFKSIFLLYAIDFLSLKENEAIAFFSTFMSLSYATSLIGGTLADKLIGAHNSLIIGGSLSCISIFILSLFPQSSVYIAMALLSVGLGCFKPNFSTMLSMLFKDTQDLRKDSAFTTLYIAMNIGSFIGPLAVSFMSRTYGWRYGLMLIVISFLSGTLLYFKQSQLFKNLLKKYVVGDIGKALLILLLVALGIHHLFIYQIYFHGLMGMIMLASIISFGVIFYKATPQERQGLLKAIFYIFLFTIFCTLYEQCGGSLMLFFDRLVDRQVLNLTLPSSSLLSINPILVLIFGIIIPIIATRFSSKKPSLQGLTKFSIGFFLTSFSFGVLSLAAHQGHIPLSIFWMLSAIILQTLGELLIVPVGFANISRLVPKRYIGFMMGLWLMAISYGHYLAGLFANYSLITADGKFENTLDSFSYFFMKLSIFPLIISAFLVLLIFKRKSYKRA